MEIGSKVKIERRHEDGRHMATWIGRLVSYDAPEGEFSGVAALDNTGVPTHDGYYALGRKRIKGDEYMITTISPA